VAFNARIEMRKRTVRAGRCGFEKVQRLHGTAHGARVTEASGPTDDAKAFVDRFACGLVIGYECVE
jgi:hypothetical protein